MWRGGNVGMGAGWRDDAPGRVEAVAAADEGHGGPRARGVVAEGHTAGRRQPAGRAPSDPSSAQPRSALGSPDAVRARGPLPLTVLRPDRLGGRGPAGAEFLAQTGLGGGFAGAASGAPLLHQGTARQGSATARQRGPSTDRRWPGRAAVPRGIYTLARAGDGPRPSFLVSSVPRGTAPREAPGMRFPDCPPRCRAAAGLRRRPG
jgi:hypothetical protein